MHYDSINDLAWLKNKLLMTASSDGYCSFIAMDEQIVGEVLPSDSELIPEQLRDHFKTISEVNFEKKVEEVNNTKQSSFMKVSFKSKKDK